MLWACISLPSQHMKVVYACQAARFLAVEVPMANKATAYTASNLLLTRVQKAMRK